MVGFWGPIPLGASVAATSIFPPKRSQKLNSEIKCHNINFTFKQSIDNSLLSSHKKLQPDWSKNGWEMAEKRMPIFGIIGIFRDFLAYNLAKYQYFFDETKFIRLVLSKCIFYASYRTALSAFAFFAQYQSLILLLLLNFSPTPLMRAI